ncbi:hypothetical protein, partial [Vibrio paucivorans]
MLRSQITWCMVLCMPLAANACDLFSSPSSNRAADAPVLANSGVCFSVEETLDFASKQWVNLSSLLDEDDTPPTSSYWDDWVLKSKSDPILTQSVSSNYFGIGVWRPTELKKYERDMSTEEWLLSHGLQLSVGFGEKKV